MRRRVRDTPLIERILCRIKNTWRHSLARSVVVASPSLKFLLCACLLGGATPLFAQQAVAPPGSFSFTPPAQAPNVTLDGMALAQADVAIEQSRLRNQTMPPMDVPVDANGNAISVESVDSDDDSLGAQRILKAQEPVRSFVVTGGITFVYTSNVALTRRATRHDVFAVVDAGIGWNRRLAKNLEGTFSVRASLFRYDRTPGTRLRESGFGAGLRISWKNAAASSPSAGTTLPNCWIVTAARS